MAHDLLRDDGGEELASEVHVVGLLVDGSVDEGGDEEASVLDGQSLDGFDSLADVLDGKELQTRSEISTGTSQRPRERNAPP